MATKKYLDNDGVLYLWQKIKNLFVAKESGKGLSTNDLTDALKQTYDDTVTTVAGLVAEGGEANVIETVKVNGTALTPDANKAVNVTVPTNTNQLTNGAGYQTASQVRSAINTALSSVMTYKGTVATVSALPSNATTGDVWNVTANGHNYAWSGTAWDDLGGDVDLSAYYTSSQVDGFLDDKQASSVIINVTYSSGSYFWIIDGQSAAPDNLSEISTAWNAGSNIEINLTDANNDTTKLQVVHADLGSNGGNLTCMSSSSTSRALNQVNVYNIWITADGGRATLATKDLLAVGAMVGVRFNYTSATAGTWSAFDESGNSVSLSDLYHAYGDGNTVFVYDGSSFSPILYFDNNFVLYYMLMGHYIKHTLSSDGTFTYQEVEFGEANVIETVQVNGTALTPDANKAVNISAATTSAYGVTQLSSATNSTSEAMAATPKAVKTAYDLANGKQDALTFDTTPTSASTNPVTSGGVYTALSEKANDADLVAITNAEIDTIVAS